MVSIDRSIALPAENRLAARFSLLLRHDPRKHRVDALILVKLDLRLARPPGFHPLVNN